MVKPIVHKCFSSHVCDYCLSGAVCHSLSPSDPSLRTVPLEDGDVSEEVPRVGLEEMLQEMNISDEGGGGARGE